MDNCVKLWDIQEVLKASEKMYKKIAAPIDVDHCFYSVDSRDFSSPPLKRSRITPAEGLSSSLFLFFLFKSSPCSSLLLVFLDRCFVIDPEQDEKCSRTGFQEDNNTS